MELAQGTVLVQLLTSRLNMKHAVIGERVLFLLRRNVNNKRRDSAEYNNAPDSKRHPNYAVINTFRTKHVGLFLITRSRRRVGLIFVCRNECKIALTLIDGGGYVLSQLNAPPRVNFSFLCREFCRTRRNKDVRSRFGRGRRELPLADVTRQMDKGGDENLQNENELFVLLPILRIRLFVKSQSRRRPGGWSCNGHLSKK